MSRVRVQYKPDHEGMAAFMLSEQARKPVVEAAKDMVAVLRETVHRSNGDGGADGHLADSYKVNRHSEPVSMGGNLRVGAEVYSEHPAAAPEEFGGRRNAARNWLSNVGSHWHVPKKGV